MASSLGAGGPGVAGVVAAAPRRANLEFPPPPPYPPPHSTQLSMDIANGSHSMHPQQPSMQPLMQRSLQDYSYAYYEPGPSRLHPPYPLEVTGVAHHSPTTLQRPPNQRPEAAAPGH